MTSKKTSLENSYLENSYAEKVRAEILSDNNLKRKLDDNQAFVREMFLANGIMSNPLKTYHLEFTLNEQDAQRLTDIFALFEVFSKKIARNSQVVVYIKEANAISDVLKIIGATKSFFDFENIRVKKEISNKINRQVNFETANINKTVAAASNQVEAIEYILGTKGLDHLSSNLKEVASTRLNHPLLSITEIGQMLTPKLSKSGVNHRLRKICKIASELKENTK